jgi:serine protease AprX
MSNFNLKTGRINIIITGLFLLCSTGLLYGQGSQYSYYYRVYLKDKGANSTGSFKPEDLLSPKALDRREKSGIPVPDILDIPVYKGYLNQISALGFKLHCTSKWMNSALFKSQLLLDITKITDLPFVSEVKIVKTPGKKNSFNDKLDFVTVQADFPPFDRPVTMVNGSLIHNSGFDGKGILIAVLDGGFINADQISSLDALRSRNGIKSTYDFVENNEFVYNNSTHGTAVLSILAGILTGSIEGTAPGADYLLLKTEDVSSEFPCEEDFWAAGAEFADSAGVDIISSSLGYYNFDDPDLNYKYSDLDGKSAFVTRVADIASLKGILVVNSAGNERTRDWKRIIFPADGNNIIAVGAVDGTNIISAFSSAGPSSDGRVKPDNTALGVSVPVQTSLTSVDRSNGTSFSCPVLSGMAACLLQAVPRAKNTDIIEVLHSSADRYNFPDSLYGYGTPDLVNALSKLQDLFVIVPDEETTVGPNPTTGNIDLIFRQPSGSFSIEIISMTGKIIFRKNYPDFTGRTVHIEELQNREQGIYFIRIIKPSGINVNKIIKLKD